MRSLQVLPGVVGGVSCQEDVDGDVVEDLGDFESPLWFVKNVLGDGRECGSLFGKVVGVFVVVVLLLR